MKEQIELLIQLGLSRDHAISFIKSSILSFVDDYNLIQQDIIRDSVDTYITQELHEEFDSSDY